MGPLPRTEAIYLPGEVGAEQLAALSTFLTRDGNNTSVTPRYFLTDAHSGARIELPQSVLTPLRQVVQALEHDLAVSVSAISSVVTTQQVGDLLGISHATVTRLLDEGELPYELVGAHRRVQLADALSYRAVRRARQYDALEQTSED